MTRDDALAFLAGFVPERFPGADTALLCGSTARGEAGPASDLDLVVIYYKLNAGAYRVTERHEGVLVEAFVHDLDTLRYFFDMDARTGRNTLAAMVLEGVPVPGLPCRFHDAARSIARRQMDAGPPALDRAVIDRQRYTICNLVDDLLDDRSRHQRLAIASVLYTQLGDFILRAAGEFGGEGKGLAAALEAYDSDLAQRIDVAFAAFYDDRDARPIAEVVERALAPYGGRLMDGYRADAPDDWRSTQSRVALPDAQAKNLIVNGLVVRWPTKAKEKQLVLDYLASKFEADRIYAESEVNDILKAAHSFGDWALLRREMYEARIFDRDPRLGTYWLLPRPWSSS